MHEIKERWFLGRADNHRGGPQISHKIQVYLTRYISPCEHLVGQSQRHVVDLLSVFVNVTVITDNLDRLKNNTDSQTVELWINIAIFSVLVYCEVTSTPGKLKITPDHGLNQTQVNHQWLKPSFSIKTQRFGAPCKVSNGFDAI